MIGLASAWVADSAWKSVTRYQPEYTIEANLPAGEPAVERLVLIVADGVRADAVGALPAWQALAERGASGIVEAPEPSLSNPARATMTTGAPPEIHGVTHNGFQFAPPVQSLLSVAHGQRIPTASFGSDFWRRAYGDFIDSRRDFEKELHGVDDATELVAWQRETCDAMTAFVAEQERGLIIAGLTAGDAAGHDFGGRADAYLVTLRAVDECLGRIVEQLDDGGTVFLVVSDHGHIDRRGRGGHGGREPEVVDAPFVLAGPGVQRAEGIRGSMRDIAPTAALLLGLPLPANSQGEPLWAAIGRDPAKEARWREQQELERSLVPRRETVEAEERRGRAPLAYALIVWLLAAALGAVALAGKPWPRFALALLVFFAAYAWFFWALGLDYSLSAIVRQEYTNSFFLRDIAAAALAFVGARRMLRVSDQTQYRRRALLLAVVITSVFALRGTWIYLTNGLLMGATLPNLQPAFTAYLDLLAVFGVGLMAALGAAMSAAAGLIPRGRGAGGSSPDGLRRP